MVLASSMQLFSFPLVQARTHPHPSITLMLLCFALFLPVENPYKVDVEQITQRAKLLQRYLSDEKKELQALYALQALMVHMEQPASK